MVEVLRVTGDSLSPKYKEGDFVVIIKFPFLIRRLKEGDTIVFHHRLYGTLIKRILHFTDDGQIYITGMHENSLDSRRLGPIHRSAVRGKVIWHIHKRLD